MRRRFGETYIRVGDGRLMTYCHVGPRMMIRSAGIGAMGVRRKGLRIWCFSSVSSRVSASAGDLGAACSAESERT